MPRINPTTPALYGFQCIAQSASATITGHFEDNRGITVGVIDTSDVSSANVVTSGTAKGFYELLGNAEPPVTAVRFCGYTTQPLWYNTGRSTAHAATFAVGSDRSDQIPIGSFTVQIGEEV